MADHVVIQFSTTVNEFRWWPWPPFPNWASWCIRHMCHSPFSHVDIELPDGSLLGASDSPDSPIVTGNSHGVAIRPNDYEDYGRRRRMIIRTPLADDIIAKAKTQIGKPFDNKALKGFLSDEMPFTRPWTDPTQWFCSELVVWAFEMCGYWEHRPSVWPKDRISPSDIFMLFLYDANWINRDTFWAGTDKYNLAFRRLSMNPRKKADG
jgi:hypothetical protein